MLQKSLRALVAMGERSSFALTSILEPVQLKIWVIERSLHLASTQTHLCSANSGDTGARRFESAVCRESIRPHAAPKNKPVNRLSLHVMQQGLPQKNIRCQTPETLNPALSMCVYI
jgi:hypothetical protein